MKPLFFENELPVDSLVQMGLWKNNRPSLDTENMRALLAGRRTDLLTLENVHADGFVIAKLDVKLSLQRSENGTVSLLAHPIYHQVQGDDRLTEKEMTRLTSQDVPSLSKPVPGKDGKAETMVFEYDAQTREILAYSPYKVEVPEEVNGMKLTKNQKALFQFGEQVELPDGTTIQHRAADPKGMLSDRAALVISVLLDGGLSYLLIRGISSLLRQTQKDYNTESYQRALEKVQQKTLGFMQERGQDRGQSRGVSR